MTNLFILAFNLLANNQAEITYFSPRVEQVFLDAKCQIKDNWTSGYLNRISTVGTNKMVISLKPLGCNGSGFFRLKVIR